MNRVKRIIERNGATGARNSSTRALAVLAAGLMIAGAGYAQAALRAQEPRAETVDAVRAGVASGVMTEDQARRIYQEVLLPGSWLEERCEQERAYWEKELGTYGLSEERLKLTLEALERDFHQRIEQDFRTRVMGMDSKEVILSLYAEELDRRKQEEGLSAEEADRLYAKRLERLNRPPLVINTPEPDGTQKVQQVVINISSNEGTVDGTPVRLAEGNNVAGEYEVTAQAGADGAYKPGQRIRFTPGLPTSVYRVMTGKSEAELFNDQAGAGEPAAKVEGAVQSMEFTLQRMEPGLFELSRGTDPEKSFPAVMHESVPQIGEQAPLQPAAGQQGLVLTIERVDSGAGDTIELEIKAQQTPAQEGAPPTEVPIWYNLGVRSLSDIEKDFASDDGC